MKKSTLFIYYLLYYAAFSFLMPFIILYYQGLGFNGAQIGLLAGMAPLIFMLGAPLWTGLADTNGKHKLIMSLTTLGAVLFAVAFPFFKSFTSIIILCFLFPLFSSPIMSFTDSATMTMLGSNKAKYGRVRLGGTIGWGLVAPLAGFIIQAYGISWAFWGYAIIMLLAFFVSQKFTFGESIGSISFKGDLIHLLSNRRWIFFVSLAFISGAAFNTINSYLFPYMEELGIQRSIMGIALTIATLSELPILFFANRLLKRFGAFGLLLLSMSMTGVRLLLLTMLNFQSGILIFQPLNGMTFPLTWVACVSYADEHAPQGMKATAQGLIGAMVNGFGAAVGGFAGGLMLGSIGARWMFLVFAGLILVSVGVVILYERIGRARQARGLV